ncbi:MAG: hypothetical protein ILA06_06660 [Bacteroidaceae bacterium]|nr:hypothetical protein [Bacteroidaceae bacterium]
MDYKYIEQLISRYLDAETSVEEEQILRQFFAQAEVPEHLRPWQSMFAEQALLAEAHLDERFDERVLAMVGETHVRAKQITLRRRLAPLFTAAAAIALAIVVGSALEQSFYAGVEAATEQAAVQDELDPNETVSLDIRSAELIEPADTLAPKN